MILEVAAGFTPFGLYYDLKDVSYEAVQSGDSKAIGLSLIGFLPVGDCTKGSKKNTKERRSCT